MEAPPHRKEKNHQTAHTTRMCTLLLLHRRLFVWHFLLLLLLLPLPPLLPKRHRLVFAHAHAQAASSTSPFESWTNNHANNRPLQTNPSLTSQTRVSIQTLGNDDDMHALSLRLRSSSYDLIIIGHAVPRNATTTCMDRLMQELDANGVISFLLLETKDDNASAKGVGSSSSSVTAILPPLVHPSSKQEDDDDDNDSFMSGSSTGKPRSDHRPTRVVLVRMGGGTTADHARKVGASLASLIMAQTPASTQASKRRTTDRGTKRRRRSNNKEKEPPPPPSFAVLLPLGAAVGNNNNNATTTTDEWMTEFTTSFLLGFYKDKRFQKNKKQQQQQQEPFIKSQQQVQRRTVDLLVDMAAPHATITARETDSDDDTVAETTRTVQSRLTQAMHRGGIMANGVALSRDIVNAPHNVLNSYSLAATALQLGKLARRNHARGTLSCRILHARDCERLGMGAFLGVARASETEAQFIHLTYKSPSRSSSSSFLLSGWNSEQPQPRRLGIVGKGLLFDTGGYSIKSSTGMIGMKMDCGGAAAVLGAAQALAELEPANVEIHFLIAACENMINDKGMVPGDILTASNGKTIEVINTDAEGRLTMADALVYADLMLNCHAILELSTLTGQCVMALGSAMAGYWTRHDDLAADLERASRSSGEQLWRMPMAQAEYGDEIKSKLADLRNIGTNRNGGAIHAALFLQHFVRPHVPFAHVDIAGPAMNMKTNEGTGWGAKLITEWVMQQQQQQQAKD